VFGYTEEEYVSTDILGITYASIFDASQTLVCKVDDACYEIRVAAWFDNENSFASQVVRTINHIAKMML
jgi:glyceraldehyde 3-phosphate dehydrogenase